MPLVKSSRAHLWDYFILTARMLLAYTFIHYGYAKLAGGQFGISAAEAAQPVSQVSLFRLSWYLFAQEPFKSFVGISQIVAGLLLLWNRTALVGALLLLPIAANILVIDITYLKMSGLYWRVSYYIGLIFLIFWHYRDRMSVAFRSLTQGLTTRFSYSWWAYALLPVAVVAAEFMSAVPRLLFSLLSDPPGAWRGIVNLVHFLQQHFMA